MNIWVIIPAYNEEAALAELIKKVKAKGVSVLAVDDGSIDNTYLVARKWADIALHNDMLSEVLLMIDDKPDEFFRGLAHKILNREKKAKKSFLSMISEQLISIPNKKG